MFYVYFLRNFKNNDLYIGSTENLENRLHMHNLGKVKSTKFYRPWKLAGYEEYKTRSEAVRMENFSKADNRKNY